ncbi:hypothetical protein WJX73_004805 [Symbiochloris irregularis]|uniref:Uncharacterized protein n=1 Tax=Symbiochloris irregularis TaxID=706552 RepID=A0AAW1P2E7_9CHLO
MSFLLKQAEGFLDAVDKRAKDVSTKQHRRFSDVGSGTHKPNGSSNPQTGAHGEFERIFRTAQQHSERSEGGATSAEPSGERRLTRLVAVVEQLKRRLETMRGENEQLEGMLHAADLKAADAATRAQRLEGLLAEAQLAASASAAEHAALMAGTQAEVEQLRQAAGHAQELQQELQESYASLQNQHRLLVNTREESEGQLVEGLRRRLDAAEAQLEGERAGQATTQRTFAAREAQLEANLTESSQALASMQRELDGRVQQLDTLSDHVRAQDAELAALRLQLSHTPRGQQSAGINQQQQVDSLRAQVHHERDRPDLQRQFKEVTDLLYQKQAQLEEMAASKAVQQMTFERELSAARHEAERSLRGSRKQSAMHAALLSEGDLIVPMEAMGDAYYRLSHHKRFGHAFKAAAKALDSTSAASVTFLKSHANSLVDD